MPLDSWYDDQEVKCAMALDSNVLLFAPGTGIERGSIQSLMHDDSTPTKPTKRTREMA